MTEINIETTAAAPPVDPNVAVHGPEVLRDVGEDGTITSTYEDGSVFTREARPGRELATADDELITAVNDPADLNDTTDWKLAWERMQANAQNWQTTAEALQGELAVARQAAIQGGPRLTAKLVVALQMVTEELQKMGLPTS